MKQRIVLLLVMVCMAIQLPAIVYTPDNLPIPYLQDERRHTINPDGILSAEAVASIDTLLYRAEHEHGVQALCIVVGEVEGGDMFSFGIDLARKYKIGNDKQDTGLLFLLSTKDRSYYILTGHGLEGILPDAICKRIENKYMLPYLKEGDWNNAMVQAITQTCSYFDGDETLKYEADKEEEEDEIAILVLVIVFIVGFTLIVFGAAYQQSKCPKCGKHKLKKQSTILLSHSRGVKKKQVTYMCMNCGHLVQRIETEYDDNYHNPGGIIIGSGGFGGSHYGGGGGFSGGHFGGGSFGGGGAGGRF